MGPPLLATEPFANKEQVRRWVTAMGRDPDAIRERLGGPRPRICPSLLNCDFAILADEVREAARCGAASVHWDVMDGHFVPNLSYGPPVIRSLRPRSDLVFETHLMMSDPGKYLDDFLDAGCDTLTIHLEAVPEPAKLLTRIREGGALAGLAINPPTPVEALEPWLDNTDLILMMSVMPGFGGQQFDPRALPKLTWAREHARPGTLVQVDGGVNAGTIADAVTAGAGLLVVGSAFYGAQDRKDAYDRLDRLMDRT
jgi:ribulose-phosphate 3-epimerase